MEESPQPTNEETVEISDGKTQCRNRPVEGRSKRRSHASSTAPGLLGLVPDSILPPESKQHLWNARRETLLAGRSLVRAVAQRMQQRLQATRSRTRSIREMVEEDED
jgi:hypothetical protein